MSWSGVKKQTNIENIKAWCEEMGIKKYTINDKGEIDVDGTPFGGVYLYNKNLEELPYKFGRVNGFFDVGNNKNLISLKNCPDEVEGYFSCFRCINLSSLEGCPKEVRGTFFSNNCKREFTEEEIKSLCRVNKNIICV